MVPSLAIGNLIQHAVSQMKMPQDQLTLKENQIIKGQVLKIFPDQKAHIQIGQSTLVAQLEAPINALQSYWFRVKGSHEQGLELKIVKQVDENKVLKHSPAKDLLSLFQQKLTKENILLANELIKGNMPITKDQLVSAVEILKNTPKDVIPQTIEAIKFSLKQQYPISEGIVRSLTQAQSNPSLANQISILYQNLQYENQQTMSSRDLTLALSNLIHKPVEQLAEIENANGLHSLKELLVAASREEQSPLVKDQINQLINRLNGQVLLQQDHGPTSQFITQVPLFALNQTDLTIQWNGKKRSDGTIDPAFCRILFYLQLPNLSETMIDVQIQNRVMTLTFTNNHEALFELVNSNSDDLKKLLKNMNYQVTSVQVKPFETKSEDIVSKKNQVNITSRSTSYTGVDFKI